MSHHKAHMNQMYFIKNGVKYKIMEGTVMMFEGEITDAIRFGEMKSNNDLPQTFIQPESVFFAKVNIDELKWITDTSKHIASPEEQKLLDRENIRWKARYGR